MPTTITLSEKGQLTFDQQLMEHLGVQAGEKIRVDKLSDGSLKIAAEKNRRNIMRLAGSLAGNIRLDDDELRQAIEAAHVNAGLKGLS